MDKIDEILDGMEDLPPALHILPALLQALDKEDTDIDRVVDLIRLDPTLTIKLLSTCNSAFWGRPTPVNSVAEAIQRLGFQTVYRIVAAMVGRRLYTPSQPVAGNDPANNWWRHAVMTAFAVHFVSDGIVPEPGMMFTAGLLHDLGKVVLARKWKVEYTLLQQESGLTECEIVERERAAFGVDHAEIGGCLLVRWRFSPGIVASVRFHHDPLKIDDEGMRRLAACVHLGNALAHGIEGGNGRQTISETNPPISVAILNQSPNDLALHTELITGSMKYIEAMCRLS